MSILDYLKDMFNHPEKYTKFWVALSGFVLALFTTYFPTAEWVTPFTAFLTAIGVFALPNVRGTR
jgi:hypothetical protein